MQTSSFNSHSNIQSTTTEHVTKSVETPQNIDPLITKSVEIPLSIDPLIKGCMSQSETDCTKSSTNDLLLRKENTEILASRTVDNGLNELDEFNLMKAASMPNVSITSNCEELLAMGADRKLKPLKIKPAKRKKKELRKRLMQLNENSDCDSLASSFNSYLGKCLYVDLGYYICLEGSGRGEG